MEYPYLHTFFVSSSLFLCIASLSCSSPFPHAVHNHTFKIQLIHRDFNNPNLSSQLEKWMSAMDRSIRRLEYFEEFLKAKVGTAEAASDDYEAPVWSNLGSYLTDLTIGTPGSSVRAIVDTGSDLVWQQCAICISCFNQKDPIFDPLTSSTYRKASCQSNLCQSVKSHVCLPTCFYTYSYGDSSKTRGDLSYDTLTLAEISGQKVSINQFGFGCSHETSGDFNGAGGLLGLGRGPLSMISQLSIQKFSYCLVSLRDSRSQTSPMFLGDAAADVIAKAQNVQSTPMLTNPKLLMQIFYYIKMTGISVGGSMLNIPPSAFEIQDDGQGGVILDSGTTLTYFTQAIYGVLLQAFESEITDLSKADGSGVGLDLCYERTGEVPSLTFHLDGAAKLDVPVGNYFINTGNLFCLAMAAANSGMSILGNIQQQNFQILYDLANQRISFAQATCDTL